MNTLPDNIQIISSLNGFSFIKTWYDLSNESHFWMQWRVVAFQNQASAVNIPLKEKLKGIEVGCGHGVLRRQIKQITNWSIDGAELDFDALKRNPAGEDKLYLYDITEKNKNFAGKYDFLFIYDVLEHNKDIQPFLNACAFHMKKNGFLFVNVPACQFLHSAYDTAQGHYKRYTKKVLFKELMDNGFKILDIRYWGFFLTPLLVIRKCITSEKQSPESIITKGFNPPSPQINSLLKGLMKFETTLFKKPPVGTSVMAIAQKL